MSKREYEHQFSLVQIELNDREVISYTMSAGPRLMSYVTEEARQFGFLTLRNDEEGSAISVPVANIRKVDVRLLK